MAMQPKRRAQDTSMIEVGQHFREDAHHRRPQPPMSGRVTRISFACGSKART
jgi:hypothetical protein